ncbi:MAG: phosphoribosyl-ATP diphosphatase [Anaerolinea sp.]|nr:phosphoribosyl-ATP diphosphatase [Anaerolinea sp.]MCC6975486.1 phosphoribosyl-ATP diphosphatase [Anaerolineae bacterium]
MSDSSTIVDSLFATILDRKTNPKTGSYTTQLFSAGLDEISKKVGEEAVEVVIAAHSQGKERLISELADLTYHALVLLAQCGLTPDDICAELARRHK